MKKFFAGVSIILAVVITMATAGSTTVTEASSYLLDLQSMEILSGIDVADMNRNVTRAEFAQLTVNLMRYNELAKSLGTQQYFTDISQSEYKDAISILYKFGYISGDGTGLYFPDNYIKYAESCKILASVLGYNEILTDKSLTSYMGAAARAGITKNVVASGENLTLGEVCTMLYNTLDAARIVPEYTTNPQTVTYIQDTENTFRAMIENGPYSQYRKYTGLVSADVSTYLYNAVPDMKGTQIEIGGKLYDYNGTAPIGMVGMTVDYYVCTDDRGNDTVVGMEQKNNEVYNIFGDDITAFTQNEIRFTDEDNRKTTLDFDTATVRFIYNNRYHMDYNPSVLQTDANMVVRAIDNDNDNKYEIVYIFSYVHAIAENVFQNEGSSVILFRDGYLPYDKKQIVIKYDEKDAPYTEIFDAYGNLTDISAVTSNSVISVAQSADGTYVRLVVSGEEETGVIETIGEDFLEINGKQYGYYQLGEESRLGNAVRAYVNFLGYIVRFEKLEDGRACGYAFTVDNGGSGIRKKPQVKMLLPGTISTKSTDGEVDADTGEVTTKSTSLYLRNSDVAIYELADDVRLDGDKISGEEALDRIKDKPVYFTFNSEGKINRIDIMTTQNSGTNITFNKSENTFGKAADGNPFAIIPNTTYCFCVPADTSTDDDSLKIYIDLVSGTAYTDIYGYNVQENTSIAEAVVYRNVSMDASLPGAVNKKSDVALVKKQRNVYSSETDDYQTEVTLVTPDGEVTYKVSTTVSSYSKFQSLGKGDVIAYHVNNFDELTNYVMVRKNSPSQYEDFRTGESSDYENCCGIVTDVEYNKISNRRNCRINSLTLDYSSGEYTYDYLITNAPPTYLIDENNEPVAATFEDIIVGDRVFVYVSQDNIRALVIKR